MIIVIVMSARGEQMAKTKGKRAHRAQGRTVVHWIRIGWGHGGRVRVCLL